MTAISERLLTAALAWGALTFGAVYSWAYWPLAVVCATLGIAAIRRTRAFRDERLRHLGLALAAVCAAVALQLVALPYAVVAHVSPGFDRFFREYSIAYPPASLHPLSIDPRSTLIVLMLLVAFSLLLIGLTSVLRYSSLEWLINQVMGLGLALALIGILQKAVMDPAEPMVYGFWRPHQGGNPFGPFINRNHFAGWMVMALPLVVGYSCAILARTWRPLPRWRDRLRWMATVEASQFVLVGFCALLMGMALALTGSRSGIASFVVGMVVFAALAVRGFRSRRVRLMVLAYFALMVVGAVAWAGMDAAVGRFQLAHADSWGRLRAWRDALSITADFPWFGTGLGTFGKAMLVYQTADRPWMYAQAHNDYLQLLAEGGAVVALTAAVAAWMVVSVIRRRVTSGMDDPLTYWVRLGAIAGLAGIAAQSAVEFSLQMPGNAVLLVLLLGLALHRPRSAESRRSSADRASRVRVPQHAHRV